MRETYGSLLLTAQNLAVDPTTISKTDLSDSKTFLQKQINQTCRSLYNLLRNHKVSKTGDTIDSVDGTQYYDLPPDFGTLKAATMTVNSVDYPLVPVDSQENWDLLNQVDFSGTVIPQFIFIRDRDFGIWPTPTEDGLDIILKYNFILKDMANDDYQDGTVAVANAGTTITGTDTTFTASMVGRWFKADDDGDWYYISAYTDATHLTIDRTFVGSSVSGSSYTIGESPNLPVVLHEFIPYKAVATYLAGPRRNPKAAQSFLNYFWTGDFENANRRMKNAAGGVLQIIRQYNATGRSDSHLVNRKRTPATQWADHWSGTIS